MQPWSVWHQAHLCWQIVWGMLAPHNNWIAVQLSFVLLSTKKRRKDCTYAFHNAWERGWVNRKQKNVINNRMLQPDQRRCRYSKSVVPHILHLQKNKTLAIMLVLQLAFNIVGIDAMILLRDQLYSFLRNLTVDLVRPHMMSRLGIPTCVVF